MWPKLPWILTVVVIVIVLLMGGVAAWLLQHKESKSDTNRPTQSLLEEQEDKSCGLPSTESVAATETVYVTGVGFNQDEVAIKVGQTIRWVNNGTSPHRVVVGPHPLHNACIGLDSKELAPQGSFGFTFTKPGEWVVHDEKQITNQGKIIVTE